MTCLENISIPLAYGFDNPTLILESLQALLSPLGFVFACGGVLMLFGAIASRRMFWAITALMLFISSATSHQGVNESSPIPPYTPIIETMAVQGRNLVLLCLMTLALPSLMINKGTRNRIIQGGLVAYLCFQILYTFEFAASKSEGSILRIITASALYVLTFLVFGFGLSKMLQSMQDAVAAVQSLAWAGVFFVLTTAVELVLVPKSLIVNGRLVSLCATATFAAELLVAVMLPALYLVLRTEANRRAKLFWIAVLSAEGLMLIGTGTRTGLVMLFVGLVVMLRSRIAKLFPVAIGLGIIMALLLMAVPDDLGIVGGERMMDTTDTRTGPWSQGLEEFKNAPFFGASTEGRFVIIENSYIDAFAEAGLVGTMPFVIALMLFARALWQIQSRRSHLDKSSQLMVDLLIAGLVSELLGGMFDAYLLATVSIQLYVVVIYVSLIQFVIDRTEPSPAQMSYTAGSAPKPLPYDPAYAI